MLDKISVDPTEWLAWLRKLRSQRQLETGRGAPLFGAEIEPHGPKFDAPARLRATHPKDFFLSDTYVDQQTRADWQQTDRAIQEFASRFVLQCRKLGVPMFTHCAFRSPAEQHDHFKRHVSKNPGPVAPHVYGCAVDIIHSRFAWNLTDAEWQFLGTVGKECARKMGVAIDWGGDWGADWARGKRGWDPAHWELVGWRDLGGIPDPDMPPIRKTPSMVKTEGYAFVKGYTGARKGS